MNRHERRRAAKLARTKKDDGIDALIEEDEGGVFFATAPNFETPWNEQKLGLASMAAAAHKNFKQQTTELLKKLANINPIEFLASMSHACLTASLGDEGVIREKDGVWDKKLQQFHIELFQALMLTKSLAEYDPRTNLPSETQDLADVLYDVSDSHQQKSFSRFSKTDDEKELALLTVQAKLRLHTTAIRNWGYYEHVIEILHSLYTPISHETKSAIGLSASELISLFDGILKAIEERLNEYRNKLKNALANGGQNPRLESYCKQFELSDAESIALGEFVHKEKLKGSRLKTYLMCHSEYYLSKVYTFTLSELQRFSGSNAAVTQQTLSHLSLEFSSLSESEFERFFLDNPIWTKPLIHTADDEYLCFMPILFFAFAFHFFNSHLGGESKTRKIHELRRSEYLENEISDLMKTKFGSSSVEENVKWVLGDQRFETDVIVDAGNTLILIEAKSQKITWPALRGAPDRMRRHIKETIEHPAIQSLRLQEVLRIPLAERPTNFSISTKLDLDSFDEIIRLSVTLEDFATLQSNVTDLHKAGLLSKEVPATLTMTIADFAVVAEILDSPAELLLYLKRREKLQNSGNYTADEIDLLGLFLANGFNFPSSHSESPQYFAMGMSQKIDDYFEAKYAGIEVPKPKTSWSH